MLVFKEIKFILFNLILIMNEYFESTNIILTVELNSERNHSKQRWYRVKEYFSQLNDANWKKSFKDIKEVFRDTPGYTPALDRGSVGHL